MASTYLRAALAAAAGAALITMSTSGYAAWQSAAVPAPEGASLEAGPVKTLLTSPGGSPRTVDTQAGIRARVGDTVTVEVPVIVHTGGVPRSTLTVDVPPAAGDRALAAELTAVGPRVEVVPLDGGPDLEPVAGRSGAHTVPAAADGHTYAVRWSAATRITRDGKAPGARNGWGNGPESLQGASVGARPLTVSLTSPSLAFTDRRRWVGTARDDDGPHPERSPVMTRLLPLAIGGLALTAIGVSATQALGVNGTELPATPSTTVQVVVPEIRMDTTAVRVATAPGGSTLSPLGTLPVSVRPTSVTMTAQPPLKAADLPGLLAEVGVEIRWGETGCDATTWSVEPGDFDKRAVAAPKPTGTTTEAPLGQGRRTCALLASSLSEDELVQRFAGRTVLARTQWESAAPAPVSWSSTATTKALLTGLDVLPAPVRRALPVWASRSLARRRPHVELTSASASPAALATTHRAAIDAVPAGREAVAVADERRPAAPLPTAPVPRGRSAVAAAYALDETDQSAENTGRIESAAGDVDANPSHPRSSNRPDATVDLDGESPRHPEVASTPPIAPFAWDDPDASIRDDDPGAAGQDDLSAARQEDSGIATEDDLSTVRQDDPSAPRQDDPSELPTRRARSRERRRRPWHRITDAAAAAVGTVVLAARTLDHRQEDPEDASGRGRHRSPLPATPIEVTRASRRRRRGSAAATSTETTPSSTTAPTTPLSPAVDGQNASPDDVPTPVDPDDLGRRTGPPTPSSEEDNPWRRRASHAEVRRAALIQDFEARRAAAEAAMRLELDRARLLSPAERLAAERDSGPSPATHRRSAPPPPDHEA
ncbi:hypothetical protein [Mobilicoccus massiliensis]|uniref:hypothetical protein n=1 Tax=Mobilicoccus massiliensis TaxID=1522310 RepID=UPI001142B434|nr:hypothetical protein [Mobilicoccus massiliensis]